MNYLLDTNIVSELRKPVPDPRLDAWRRSVRPGSSHLSVLVIGEIRMGIEQIRRRDSPRATRLAEWLDGLERSFSGNILPVSAEVAQEWGRLNVPDRIPPIDGLMAATAKVHGMTFVTRNVKDVASTGVTVLNPFEPQP